jgi:cardiolipin synthase C
VAWVIAHVFVLRGEPDTVLAPALSRFGPYHAGMNLRQAFESLPPAGGDQTELTLLPSNPEAWVSRWRMLAEARRTIDVSYFILREDIFGAAFLGHLLQKARDGVSIRLLLDAQGTVMSFVSPRGNDWIDTLANTKHIDVKMFRPLAGRYVEALVTANPVAAVASEHDKILVSDSRVSMVGGRNISAEYFAHPADMPTAFDDTDLLLEGAEVARGLTTAFETQYKSSGAREVRRERLNFASFASELTLAYRAMDAWLKDRPVDIETAEQIRSLGLSWIDDLRKYPRLRGTWHRTAVPRVRAATRLLDSNTRLEPRGDAISHALMRLVQSANDHVLIQTPYLVLSQEAVDVLVTAARRGVRVVVYTNTPISSDNALSQAFFLEQWPEILAQVPGMRLFVTGGDRTLHSKLMTFDDQVSLVGTYNLDPVSMAVNSEIMVAVWSEEFAKQVASHPRRRVKRGPPAVYEYRIRRDKDGRPLRGEDGRPIVAFGPQHHADPERWRQVQVYWALLRAMEKLPGFSPIF